MHLHSKLTTGHGCTYRKAKPNPYRDAGLPWLPRRGSNECLTGLIHGPEKAAIVSYGQMAAPQWR